MLVPLVLLSLRVGRLATRNGMPSNAFHHDEWLDPPLPLPLFAVDTEILGKDAEDGETTTDASLLSKQVTMDLVPRTAISTVERSSRCFAIVGREKMIILSNALF